MKIRSRAILKLIGLIGPPVLRAWLSSGGVGVRHTAIYGIWLSLGALSE